MKKTIFFILILCTVTTFAQTERLNGIVGPGTAYQTTAVLPIADPGFEAGPSSGHWIESSTNFGTPICDVAGCGTGNGTGPHSGDFWVWFGGISAFEEGSVSQSVTIPSATTVTLSFFIESAGCSGTGFMEVLVNGNQEYLFDQTDPNCGLLGYNLVNVDLSAYQGQTVNLDFHSISQGDGVMNFFIDDVVINVFEALLTTNKALTNHNDVDSSGTVTEGDILTYTVTVTNTGDVALSNVVASDPMVTPTGGSTPCASVAVGGTCTLVGTYTVTASDAAAGSITNTGTGDSDETSPVDDILVTPVLGSPDLTTSKALTDHNDVDSSGTVTEGDILTYTVTVTNTGNVALSNVVASDPMVTPTGGSTPCASVAVGGTCTLVGTYTVTASDAVTGSITNTGSGDSAEAPSDDAVVVTPVFSGGVGPVVVTPVPSLTFWSLILLMLSVIGTVFLLNRKYV